MATPFVRPYNTTTDFDNGLHVFYTTIDKGLDYEPTRTIGSYLWYRAYVALTPSTCVVLDDGTGRVVGYCIGASDTASFAQRWRDDFATTIDPQVIPRPNVLTHDPGMERQDVKGFRRAAYEAHCSMLLSWPDVLKKYPAHMHIDILPEYQRKGFGTALINALFDKVKSEGAVGIHLDMVKQNFKARAFYEKIGFSVADVVLDGGKSGEKGVNGIVLTLAKEFSEQTV